MYQFWTMLGKLKKNVFFFYIFKVYFKTRKHCSLILRMGKVRILGGQWTLDIGHELCIGDAFLNKKMY